jgi:hypothetical protein
VVLGAAVAVGVVYLALQWMTKVPLIAMTVATHGALALIVVCSGLITMSMRSAVTADQLELGSADAIRRNLLILWNLSLLMALLGWLGFAIGISLTRVPIHLPAIFLSLLLPAMAIVYGGTVTMLVTRLLRL